MIGYRPTKEKYPLMEALAVAVAIDREQGFIKSNQGYYDQDTDQRVDDNRTVALRTLRVRHGAKPQTNGDGVELYRVETTSEDEQKAQEIFSYFDQVLLMDKMADNLVKQGRDGLINDYNLQLSRMFDKGEIDVNKELAMIVSLPNSRRMADKRDQMDEFHASHKANGYVGDLRQRIKVVARVMDVKFLPRHHIHLATVVTEDEKLIKFFMNEKLGDMARTINGKTIEITGTVKKQEVNDFTGCQETVINRVKIGETQ